LGLTLPPKPYRKSALSTRTSRLGRKGHRTSTSMAAYGFCSGSESR
jgi:hypothetical protein